MTAPYQGQWQAPLPNYDPKPQVPYSQLLCKTCNNPINLWGRIGFCARCGSPLCERCSSTTVPLIKKSTTVIPMIIVTVRKTTTLRVGITVCRKCLVELDVERRKRKRNSLLYGIGVLVGCLAIMGIWGVIIGAGASGLLLGLCLGAPFAILVFLLASWYLVEHTLDRTLGPFCPVCGNTLTNILLQQAKTRGTGSFQMQNVIMCPYCGYYGPRAPLDGLWRFVDANGTGPLFGSVVESVANRSMHARHKGQG